MNGSIGMVSRLALVGIFTSMMAGCITVPNTEDVTAKPAMIQYRKLGLAGLTDEAKVVFKSLYVETFPTVTFVEQEALFGLVPEEVLLSERPGDDVMSRVRSDLGVEGIVIIRWEDSGAGGSMGWILAVTDTETGELTGSATTWIRKEPLLRGTPYEDLERMAFEDLISALAKELGG